MKKTVMAAILSVVCMGSWAGIAIQSVSTQGFYTLANAFGTNSYSGISANVGDVIVLTVAGNKKGSAISVNAAQVGGTGTTGPQTMLSNNFGTYPTSYAYYQTVTGAGSFDFDLTTSSAAGLTAISAVYVLRADSGIIELADSATWDDVDGTTNPAMHTLSYTFPSPLTDGVLIESVSARLDDAAGPAVYTVDFSAGNAGKKQRSLISYDGVTGSSLSSDYVLTLGDAGKQTSGAVGMVFAEGAGGNRAPVFSSDPVMAPAVLTNGTYIASLTNSVSDPDGDPVTYWKTTGPAWLSLAGNGALTGTAPGTTNLNSWTVFAADNKGGTNSAVLTINVTASEYYDVPLISTNLYVQGAKFVNIDGNGMNFHRLDFGKSYVNVNAGKAKTTTGVKLSFYTRSDTVKLHFDYQPGDENRNSRFGLYQNGVQIDTPYIAKTESNAVFNLISQSAPGELVRHDVVLPNWSNPILTQMELKQGTVLEAGNPYPAKKMVVLGDSISHGTGQGASYQTYPYIAADMMDLELFNMAVGGGKIAPEVADLLQSFDPVDAIWILVGYNDWQGASKSISAITNDYETLLATVRTNQPNAEVFCCTLVATSLIDDPESGVTAVAVRQGVSDVVQARIDAGDPHLHLVQGDSISSTNDMLNGVVHFTEPGAAVFATNVVAIMDPVINPPKPNVLFIAIDDINPIIGAYGNSLIQTPNMDALAARGMVFENAHAQWAVCGPSRASLMTGLMPEQGGVMGFTKMRGDAVNNSRDNAKGVTNLVTIPQHFISNGYETAATGKINDYRCVGSINPDGTINEDGGSVDDPPSWSYGFLHTSGVGSSTAIRTTDGKSVKLAAESVDQPATNFTDGIAGTPGIALLDALAASNKPFFLGVGFKKPHLPFLAPKSSWDLYSDSDFETNAFPYAMLNATPYTFNNIHELRSNYYLDLDGTGQALPLISGILPASQQKRLLHGYYACISHVDEQIGRVLDELDVLGLTSNTIVVLWGDHGFHLGDHNEWGKHTNLEQATRVPFIICAPGYAPGTTMAPVGLLDIYPTLCELAGLPLPEQPPNAVVTTNRPLSGKSLVPILADPAARVQTGVMSHYGSNIYGYAYRTERYRFTEWVNSSGTVLARELYDYQEDPMETVNLAVYPEYDALMYQFSVASRTANEARGCDRLKSSSALPVPANKKLPALNGTVDGTHLELAWPDAAGMTYDLMSKTNLLDASWSTNQSGLTGSPLVVSMVQDQEFYQVHIAN